MIKSAKFCASQGTNYLEMPTPVYNSKDDTHQCPQGFVACNPESLKDAETWSETICVTDLKECPITGISFTDKPGYQGADHSGELNREWLSEK